MVPLSRAEPCILPEPGTDAVRWWQTGLAQQGLNSSAVIHGRSAGEEHLNLES